jgi:hypothetical protein
MEFEQAGTNDLNFNPHSIPVEVVASYVAETSIVRSILQGSGGPENAEITDSGLRFVRHLLTTSKATRYGFMPNMKDMDAIRELARDFIRRSGSASQALQVMQSVMQG